MSCIGTVAIVFDESGHPIRYALTCKGECPNTHDKCEMHRSENHQGGIREWCGCGPEEPKECHIVLYQVGKGEEPHHAGQHYVLCAGACQGHHKCLLVDDSGKVYPPTSLGYEFPQWVPVPSEKGKTIHLHCKC